MMSTKNKAVRDALVSNPKIRDTLLLATQAQVVVMGVGVFKENSTRLRSNIFTEEEIMDLRAKGAMCENPELQDLLDSLCHHGFEHHVAMNRSQCADLITEGFETYLG